ncbi:hypothetical protein LBWT_X4140 (plasmid) [Leptolyngbya boryana IAM M-101]|nr:hypothetical protein LBWT_X4140 [Leptolyngbya boryana IAM M-101]BAS66690.1 hypothetical protein LBDG_X4140 [Leptolyngbya boryana dg5]
MRSVLGVSIQLIASIKRDLPTFEAKTCVLCWRFHSINCLY